MNLKKILIVIWGCCFSLSAFQQSVVKINKNNELPIFQVSQPDYTLSPYTGMTRQQWVDAAHYLLEGAFSNIHHLDDPMKFPKQHDKTYPRDEGQVKVEKLEGLCRTLFIAAPLLREDPNLTLNGIKVADYYRYQITMLIDPQSPSYIKPRDFNWGSQTLVEFGALAISLSIIPEIIWEPLAQDQKDQLAVTMISYGDGPTVDSNWRFFNIFVLSFFKDRGYDINEMYLIENIERCLSFYRGEGWYNDNPAYDYYSMWAFQMYGPIWSQIYGHKYYPEYARQFMKNLHEVADNYSYMFNRKGQMNMWGRSITYRFGSVIPLALLGYLDDSENINYGWMRYIASSTLLQFLQNPDFIQDNVPSLGFYRPFAPAVQIYSCRGSVYWCGKAFLALLLPKDNIFWTSTENRGAWDKELKPGEVYNKFQPSSNLMITNYPDIGGSEMRSWCHASVAKDHQQFRSSENYNKLAYHTEFPWMADGKNGEVSMNYGIKNEKNEWEVLRLYTFKSFENGMYRRDAVLETNQDVRFQLTDIPLPNGILRVDKVTTPIETDIRLGHYSLPDLNGNIIESEKKAGKHDVRIVRNGKHQLSMIALNGWETLETVYPVGLHPVSDKCAVMMASDKIINERIYVTLQLWKKDGEEFSKQELSPIKDMKISGDNKLVEIKLSDGTNKKIFFE